MTEDDLQPELQHDAHALQQELRHELQHRERQINAMRRAAESLFSTLSLEELLRETLRLAIEVSQAEAGSILWHQVESDTFVFRHVMGPIADRLSGFAMPVMGAPGRVLRSGRPEIVNEEPGDELRPSPTGYVARSIMSVPLKRFAGPPFGTMQVLNASRRFDERDMEVLEMMSAVASSAIESAHGAEEARKAQLMNVIGDISHDIKNLLTPIQSGVSTLQLLLEAMFGDLEAWRLQRPTDESEAVARIVSGARDNYEWILQAAHEAGDRVQERTKEIADAVKGEAAPLHFETCQIDGIAREVGRTLSVVAQEKDVRLILDLDDSLPDVELDCRQIYNALYNLVNNALPETPPGGSITLRARAEAEGETEGLRLEIEDTGRGMSEAVRASLFSAETISTKAGGTGLGTKIVADVVRHHGGTIAVHSEPGHGSTFSIHLPLRQASRR